MIQSSVWVRLSQTGPADTACARHLTETKIGLTRTRLERREASSTKAKPLCRTSAGRRKLAEASDSALKGDGIPSPYNPCASKERTIGMSGKVYGVARPGKYNCLARTGQVRRSSQYRSPGAFPTHNISAGARTHVHTRPEQWSRQHGPSICPELASCVHQTLIHTTHP